MAIIVGSNASDTINGTSQGDIILASNGNDTVNGGAGNDLITGGNGNDNLNGGADNDIIDGGNGNDTINGGSGIDILLGGNGDDTIDGGSDSDIVSGGNGNDTLVYKASENANAIDIYDGGKGTDTLRLIVSQTLANSAAFQSDIAALQAKLARGSASYSFNSIDLIVTSIEQLQIVIESGGNQAAVIGNPTVANVTEDASVNGAGNLTASGTISITDPDAGQASFQTAVTSAAGNLGSLTLAANGSYTYTVANSATQSLGASDVKVDQFTIKSFDGTTKTVSFTVHGANDSAVIGNPTLAVVTEDAAVNGAGNLTVTGSISISDADAGQATFSTAVGTSAGNLGSLTLTANGTYTYTVANSATQSLAQGATKVDSFTVTSLDGTTKIVSFTIQGTNDAAVITGTSTASLTETNAAQSTGGTLTATDVDSAVTFVAQSNVAGSNGYGTFSINGSGVWTYAMNGAHDEFVAGTNYTDSITVATADGTTRVLTVTIQGTNDAAIITGTSTASLTESNATQSTGGTLTVMDVDSAATFVAQSGVAGSNGHGTFSIDTAGVWTYSMSNAHDEFVAGTNYTDSITVATADGTTRVLTVTIQGTNDAAVITGTSTASLTESNAAQSTGGTLTVMDVDSAATFVAQSGVAGSNGHGTFSIDTAGVWTYSMSNAHDEFVAGTNYTDSITVATADGTTRVLTVTIQGTNDAAVITGTSTASLTESNAAQSTGGTLNAADVDSAPTFVARSGVAGSNGYGTFSIDTTGVWTYTMSNAHDEFVAGTNYTDSITVATADGTTRVLTVTIQGANDAAVITGTSTASLTESNVAQSTGGTLTAADVDSAPTFVAQSGVAGSNGYGTFSIDASGVWTYTMSNAHDEFLAGTDYTDSITVATADGTTRVLTVTIQGTNEGPVVDLDNDDSSGLIGANYSASYTENGAPLAISDADVRTTDADNASLAQATITLTNAKAGDALALTDALPAGITSTIDASVPGQISVVLSGSASLADYQVAIRQVAFSSASDNPDTADRTITVVVNDGAGNSNIATSTIRVTAVNDAPVAQNAVVSATEDTAYTFAVSDFSFSDAEGNALASVNILNVPAQGTLFLDANSNGTVDAGEALAGPVTVSAGDLGAGALKFIAAPNANGAAYANFGFSVSDGSLSSAPASATINVAAANDAPGTTAFAQAGAALDEGSAIGTIVGTATANDIDSAAGQLTFSLVNENGGTYPGPLAINPATGVITVSGEIDYESTDGVISPTVRVTDQGGLYSDTVISVAIADLTEISMSAIEGYIANATIFVDDDNNGVLSAGDYVTQSDALGNFKIVGTHTGAIYLLGGNGAYDTATGLPFDGILKAAPGSSVLSPLTTLIASLAATASYAGDVAAATAQVVAALGLPPGVDPNTFDPIAAALSGNPADQAAGTQLFAAGVQVYNTIVQAASLITGADSGVDPQAAATAVLGAIVGQVSTASVSTPISLSDTTTLTNVITSAAGSTGSDIGTTASGAANVIAGSNGLIDTALSNPDSAEVLKSVAGAATVAQGTAAQALSEAGQSGDTGAAESGFTGGSLQGAVTTATAAVNTTALAGIQGDNTLVGTIGADVLDGQGGNDIINAGGGRDTLIGGSGNDTLDGDTTDGNQANRDYAFDRADYSGASDGVTVNLAAGSAVGASTGSDTLFGIEAIVGTTGNDSFDAVGFSVTSTNNGGLGLPIPGGFGAQGAFNEFEGLAGNDTVTGNGNTRVSYEHATAAVKVNLSGANVTALSQLVLAGSGRSIVADDANVGVDTLVSGITEVRGSSFNDILIGSTNGAGTVEVFDGRGGDDYLDGNGGFDRARYDNLNVGNGGINVQLAAGTVSGTEATSIAAVGADTLRSIESIRGSQGADTFNATGFQFNTLNGGGDQGNFNEFEGMAGNDTVTGNGNTRVSYTSSSGAVTVTFTANGVGTAVGNSSVGTDTFLGGVTSVRGSNFGDVLTGYNNGTATFETFEGWAGNDTIIGGGGLDRARYDGNISSGLGVTLTTGLNFAMASGNVTVNTVTGVDANGYTLLVYGLDTLRGIESIRGTNLADVYDASGFTAASTNVGEGGTNQAGFAFNEFEGGGGNDVIYGNFNTRVSYQNASNGVTVNWSGATVSGVAANTAQSTTGGDAAQIGIDTFIVDVPNSVGVNAVRGSNSGDTFIGSGRNETFEGMGGADSISGGGGFDLVRYDNENLNGNGLNVTLGAGGTGSASFAGGPTDTLSSIESVRATQANDTFNASTFTGGSSGDLNEFEGLGGNDTITGNNNTRVSYTNAGGGVVVTLTGGGAGSSSGAAGNDTFVSGVSQVRGSNFIDTVMINGLHTAYSFTPISTAGVGSGYTIAGAGFSYTVYNFELFKFTDGYVLGNSTVNLTNLNPLGDTLPMFGSTGDDTLTIGTTIGTRQIDLGGGSSDIVNLGAAGNYTNVSLVNVETLNGSTGDDTVSNGHTGLASINLGNGNDTLVSGGGNYGAIAIDGGSGTDTLVYSAATGAMTVDLAAGTATNGIIADTFTNFESVTGSMFNDALIGSAADNTLNGADGADELTPAAGNDTVIGGTGFDRAIYTSEANAISVALAAGLVTGASTGTDTLSGVEGIRGTALNDTFDATGFTAVSTNGGGLGILDLTGLGAQGAANDFEGMGGNDTITGNGNTRINYTNASAAVTVNLATGTASGTALGDAANVGTDTIIGGVSAVRASAFDDTLVGSANGSASVESFEGLGGSDFIDGNSGFDRARYDNEALGGQGIVINLGAGTVTAVAAGFGTDTLRSIESIRGTHAADTYNASAFTATSTNGGGAGDQGNFNEFEGMGGNDTVTANGNTRISFVNSTSAVTVNLSNAAVGLVAAGTASDGFGGTDTFTVVNLPAGSGFAYGITAIRGSWYNDTLVGQANSTASVEQFEGWAGDDFIQGNGGFDRVRYDVNPVLSTGVPLTLGISADLAAGTVTGRDATALLYYGTDTLRSIESVRGTSADDIFTAVGFTFSGTVQSASNVGDSGGNSSNGAGFNEFEGMGGNDQFAGNGNTRVSYQAATSAVTVDLLAGTADGSSTGHDTFTGGNVNNFFNGIQAVRGSNFDDFLYGSNNVANTTEIFEGFGGNDWIDGRAGFDLVRYDNNGFSGPVGLAINMAAGTISSTNPSATAAIGVDTLRSIEAVRGSNANDVYDATNFGVSGANVGSNGTFNEFEGMGGNDTITGNGSTRVNYSNAGGNVIVNLATGAVTGAAGNDVITGGVNAINGSNNNDTLTGNNGNNQIIGNAGSDMITGGLGVDTLTGGAGLDNFVFTNINDSPNGVGTQDIITDFETGLDKINLVAIDANTVNGVGDDAFFFVAGDQTGVQANSITWHYDGVNTIVSADVNGDASADIIITLLGNKSLTAVDFML